MTSVQECKVQVKSAATAGPAHAPGRPDLPLPRGWTVTTKRKRITGPAEAGQVEFRTVHIYTSPEGQGFKTYGKARRHWRERGQRVRASKQADNLNPAQADTGLPPGWTVVRKRSLEVNHSPHSYKVCTAPSQEVCIAPAAGHAHVQTYVRARSR